MVNRDSLTSLMGSSFGSFSLPIERIGQDKSPNCLFATELVQTQKVTKVQELRK